MDKLARIIYNRGMSNRHERYWRKRQLPQSEVDILLSGGDSPDNGLGDLGKRIKNDGRYRVIPRSEIADPTNILFSRQGEIESLSSQTGHEDTDLSQVSTGENLSYGVIDPWNNDDPGLMLRIPSIGRSIGEIKVFDEGGHYGTLNPIVSELPVSAK